MGSGRVHQLSRRGFTGSRSHADFGTFATRPFHAQARDSAAGGHATSGSRSGRCSGPSKTRRRGASSGPPDAPRRPLLIAGASGTLGPGPGLPVARDRLSPDTRERGRSMPSLENAVDRYSAVLREAQFEPSLTACPAQSATEFSGAEESTGPRPIPRRWIRRAFCCRPELCNSGFILERVKRIELSS